MTPAARVITEAILEVVRLRDPQATEVRLDQELVGDLALGSLDLAELAATIEVRLDRPLFDDVAMNGFLTVGELVEFCEQARGAGQG